MRKICLIFLFSFSSCLSYQRISDSKGDFFDFSLSHIYGQDYEIETKDIGLPCSAFAIHGGLMEKGTDVIAKHFAQRGLNYYTFKIISKKGLKKAHITSTRFNEPQAVSMAKNSKSVISFHVMADKKDIICIGGLNKTLAERFVQSLNKGGFKTKYPCKKLPGTNPKNIANLAREGGVQLEISAKLIKKLDKNPVKLLKFIESAQEAASGFCY